MTDRTATSTTTSTDDADGAAVEPLPLSDVTVVSIALNVPGPVAVRRLQNLGASVTTVLPPFGDPLEQYSRQWYEDLHTDQQVLSLDLKSGEGRTRLTSLLAGADLFVTSSRPSALRRLGVDFATLTREHPRLCQIDIVGHAGEEAEIAGHDLTYQAVEGLVRPPVMPSTFVADLSGAERAVSEALVALRLRDTDGRGVRREIALADTAHDFAAPARYGLTSPDAFLGGGFPAYGIYRASDSWIALAALEPHFLRRAQELLDVDGSAEAYAAAFAARTAGEWEAWAAEHDVPLVAVRSLGR